MSSKHIFDILIGLAAFFFVVIYSGLWQLILILGLIVVSLAALFEVEKRLRALRKRRVERWFLRIASQLPPEKSYVLVLRSTDCDTRLSRGPRRGIIFEDPSQEVPLLYQELQRAVRPHYLKAVKNPDLTGDMPTVTYPDNEWQKLIRFDFQHARHILLIPLWPSSAVQWEIRTIIEMNLLRKVVIVMPPDPSHVSLRSLFPSRSSEQTWSDARNLLSSQGISVPAYNAHGALFVLGSEENPPRLVPWSRAAEVFTPAPLQWSRLG